MSKKTENIKNFNRVDENNIMTTEKVDKIQEKEKFALQLKRSEKLWFNNLEGIRRRGIKFAMTPDEIEEYIKCKLSVYYFAEHYCKIKLEDGTVGPMTLRNYQKDIIKLYTENRYSILMASRQVGKCISFTTKITCKNEDGEVFITNIGTLYYQEMSKFRKLTVLENVKIWLYKILNIL